MIILFGGLLVIPVLGFVLFLISYPIILSAHAISARLMIRAIVANNVSDLGDIHRAAVMPAVEETEIKANPKQASPQSAAVTETVVESDSNAKEQ